MPITLNGKKYECVKSEKDILELLNKSNAIRPIYKYPLKVGDVYHVKFTHGNKNLACLYFILIECIYNTSQSNDFKGYTLTGFTAFSTFSDNFFNTLHTLSEIEEFLLNKGAVYSHNIGKETEKLAFKYD
jgi:hypothetical protein